MVKGCMKYRVVVKLLKEASKLDEDVLVLDVFSPPRADILERLRELEKKEVPL